MSALFKRSLSLERKDALEIGGALLLRNTCLNLLGQVLPGPNVGNLSIAVGRRSQYSRGG